jgi:hypothetical protein
VVEIGPFYYLLIWLVVGGGPARGHSILPTKEIRDVHIFPTHVVGDAAAQYHNKINSPK